MPDQAAVNALFNAYNVLQPTANNGATPRREGDTGSVEVFWPCVGDLRIVPDLNSLFRVRSSRRRSPARRGPCAIARKSRSRTR